MKNGQQHEKYIVPDTLKIGQQSRSYESAGSFEIKHNKSKDKH